MTVSVYDRGSPVMIETEFQKYQAFSGLIYFDPTTPKITVSDPDGTIKVNAIDMTKEDTGKWHHEFQTEEAWATGAYNVKITCSDGTFNDVTIARGIFKLV